MEETSEELPNFYIGIDLLGPDPDLSEDQMPTWVFYCSHNCSSK